VFSPTSWQHSNGFEFDGGLLPVAEILRGGPPKDGIPAIDEPQFVSAENMSDLSPSDLVLGDSFNEIQKAYTIRIPNWHEIVND